MLSGLVVGLKPAGLNDHVELIKVKFNAIRMGQIYAGVAITASAAALLAGAAGVMPAAAATVAAPATNVHVGQVLGQASRSGNGCGQLAKPLDITVEGTAAHPDAYVDVTVNSQCQAVVSKTGYSTAGGPSGSASSPVAGSKVAASSTCKPGTWAQRETWAQSSIWVGSNEAARIPSWLDYQQVCSWGNINAKTFTFPSKNSHYVVPTTWGANAVANPNGFAGKMTLLKLEYPSATSGTGLAEAQVSYWWVPELSPQSYQLSYSIRTYNKTFSNGAVQASCQVDNSAGTQSESLTDATIQCQVGRDS
jgi:hypothetical protein